MVSNSAKKTSHRNPHSRFPTPRGTPYDFLKKLRPCPLRQPILTADASSFSSGNGPLFASAPFSYQRSAR